MPRKIVLPKVTPKRKAKKPVKKRKVKPKPIPAKLLKRARAKRGGVKHKYPVSIDNKFAKSLSKNKKANAAVKTRKRTSAFHLVINPKIPSSWFLDPEHGDERYDKLSDMYTEATQFLVEHIKDFCIPKGFNTKAHPELVEKSMSLEIGDTNEKLHLDGFLQFDGFCHLRLPKIKKLYQVATELAYKNYKGKIGKIYFDSQFVRNDVAIVRSYSSKTGQSLI